MSLWIDWLSIDSDDPDALGEWWAKALDYKVVYRSKPEDEGEREVAIARDEEGNGWRILFVEVHDERKVKNRLHLDLRPDDRDAEVARLEGLGAKRIDIGQGEKPWVVMADPEGNEFCVLSGLPEGTKTL
jgi:hypothetical protein